jgi:hypothetical protein
MNKAARMLVMTGMAIVAGAAFSSGPAFAASASPAPTAAKASTAKAPERTKIVGYYRTFGQCHKVGNIGEWRNKWDDHNCIRVRGGFHRNFFALAVSWDNHHGFPGHGGPGFPGHGPGHGPGFPGGPGHGPGWPAKH